MAFIKNIEHEEIAACLFGLFHHGFKPCTESNVPVCVFHSVNNNGVLNPAQNVFYCHCGLPPVNSAFNSSCLNLCFYYNSSFPNCQYLFQYFLSFLCYFLRRLCCAATVAAFPYNLTMIKRKRDGVAVVLWPVPGACSCPAVACPACTPGGGHSPAGSRRGSTPNTPKKEKDTIQIKNNPKSVDKYSSLCYTGLTNQRGGTKSWLKTISSLM